MSRRVIGVALIVLALCLAIAAPVLAFTPLGSNLLHSIPLLAPVPTLPPAPARFPLPQQPPLVLCEQSPPGNASSALISSSQPALAIPAKPPAISATSAYLLDADTNQPLGDLNGETSLPMASTTKIMTAMVAIESADLDQIVTIHQDAINEVTQNGGSSAQLVAGDQIRLRDLLYGLMLPSGDDAAVAIADAVGGTQQNFVNIMNVFAYRLHLFQTHYSNPDGLNAPGHYTSAYDLARLARCAMQIPLFAKIVETPSYLLPATGLHHRYLWKTTNQLLGAYKGATGIKTGTTPQAGFCLVFSATRNNHHLIGVLLHSSSEATRFSDAKKLLNWGFGLLG